LKITGIKSYQITLGVIECVDLLKTYPELRKGSPPLKPHPVENAMEERSSITTTSEHHPRQEKGKLLVITCYIQAMLLKILLVILPFYKKGFNEMY